jgi:hypothetical protein
MSDDVWTYSCDRCRSEFDDLDLCPHCGSGASTLVTHRYMATPFYDGVQLPARILDAANGEHANEQTRVLHAMVVQAWGLPVDTLNMWQTERLDEVAAMTTEVAA